MAKIEYFIKKDNGLKKIAQSIFGKKIVTEAYLCTNYHDQYGIKYIEEELKSHKFDKTSESIDFSNQMVILIINNKPICISSCDWVYISEMDMAKTKEI
jgi:hypothetical protein